MTHSSSSEATPDTTMSTTSKSYKTRLFRKHLIMWFSLLAILIGFVLGLNVGAKSIPLVDLWQVIIGQNNSAEAQIVLQLRLPRLIAALISGASLGLAGAVMQIVLRNPLGSPFTLGISNAAAFGAALAYILMDAILLKVWTDQWLPLNHVLVTFSAFIWAIIAALFILFIAKLKGATPENMILAGIIINTFFMALTAILQFLADDVQLGSIVFWTFGDLSRVNWTIVALQSLIIIPIFLFFLGKGFSFNALNAGDQVAESLGISVSSFRTYSILLASLMTATIVAAYGIIAFIGLIIPHIVRIIIGSESRLVLTGSILWGALFLLICDLISRSIFSPVIVPIGIITSIIGAPLFVFLLIKGSRKWSL